MLVFGTIQLLAYLGNKIYGYALIHDDPIMIKYSTCCHTSSSACAAVGTGKCGHLIGLPLSHKPLSHDITPALLYTNKQIYREALKFLYKENQFVARSAEMKRDFRVQTSDDLNVSFAQKAQLPCDRGGVRDAYVA